MDAHATSTHANGAESAPAPSLSQTYFEHEKSQQKIAELEQRIAQLEFEQKRFADALLNAGKFIFENPASKMMLMAFPKEMQVKLKEFFANGVTDGR